jgi:hypothetical protein
MTNPGWVRKVITASCPARSSAVDEISRHPSDMPDSAGYTRYENGQSLNPIERGDGPVTIEAHFRYNPPSSVSIRGPWVSSTSEVKVTRTSSSRNNTATS